MSKKILFYTDTPLYGGAEKQMTLLAKHLRDSGFEIGLICRQLDSLTKLTEDFQKMNLPVYLLHSRSKNSLGIFFQLNKILRREKPDIVHAQLWNPMANKHLFLLKSFYKFKLITTEHDPFALGFLKSLYKKLTLRRTDFVITVSHANQELMSELYPAVVEKITTIHNGIENNLEPIHASHRQTVRKKFFNISSPDTKIIFSAGTLHARKGFKYLFLAFQMLIKQNSDVVLCIAGEGPERKNLEKLIINLDLVNRIKLLGFKNNISELMQAADIFVLPSLKEAFGLVILEAFMAKLTVIATRAGGIPEIITDEQNGLLVKPQSKDQLYKALKKILSSDKLKHSLTSNASISLEKFSAIQMAKKTVEVYHQILAE